MIVQKRASLQKLAGEHTAKKKKIFSLFSLLRAKDKNCPENVVKSTILRIFSVFFQINSGLCLHYMHFTYITLCIISIRSKYMQTYIRHKKTSSKQ